MKFRKILIAVTTLAVLLSVSTAAFAAYEHKENIAPPAENVSQIIGDGNTVVFIDVPSNHWAKDQIDYFAQQGIINGYEDGSFRPGAGVTREEFCKLLVSTFKQPLETPNTPTFADVPENRWSYPYVEVCRDFLTGYANPFGGAPSFHPSEYATREDIAVALVRMMGFTSSDANNPNYAAQNFSDGRSISPNILAYVSIACERGLISGYPDGTFGPTKGITRAETVVLLNRATKQAVTNISAELEMTASVLYSKDRKTATINIIAEEGTTVTVNGESVKMSNNYSNEYEGNFVYKFEEEGTKEFLVEGKRAGKTKSIPVTAEYKVDAPTLTITACPTTSKEDSVEIRGVVSDTNDRTPVVTVNGKSVYVSYDGNWYTTVNLTEGTNNFEIVATNKLGKSTTVNKTVEFGVSAPTLRVTTCPQTADTERVEIRGVVSDTNDRTPVVTVNGKSVYVSYDGNWYTTVNLTEGTNIFEIVATNKLGKSTSVRKTVIYGNANTAKNEVPSNSDVNMNNNTNNTATANPASTNKTENANNKQTLQCDFEKKCIFCGHNDGTITLTLEKGVEERVTWNCSSCHQDSWNNVLYSGVAGS